jgi:hypothetical protein
VTITVNPAICECNVQTKKEPGFVPGSFVFRLPGVMVADGAVKPSGLHATILETGVQIDTDIDRCALVSLRASSRLEQRELRASLEFRMDIPFLRLLERSKAGLVFELHLLVHGAPPSGRSLRGARNSSRICAVGTRSPTRRYLQHDVKRSAEDVEDQLTHDRSLARRAEPPR